MGNYLQAKPSSLVIYITILVLIIGFVSIVTYLINMANSMVSYSAIDTYPMQSGVDKFPVILDSLFKQKVISAYNVTYDSDTNSIASEISPFSQDSLQKALDSITAFNKKSGIGNDTINHRSNWLFRAQLDIASPQNPNRYSFFVMRRINQYGNNVILSGFNVIRNKDTTSYFPTPDKSKYDSLYWSSKYIFDQVMAKMQSIDR